MIKKIFFWPDLTRVRILLKDAEKRRENMKNSKRSLLDVIILVLIILNILGIVNTAIFSDKLYRITNIFDYIITGLFMYTISITPIAIVAGIILNIISIIKKINIGKKYWLNIAYMLILVLTIPLLHEFWYLALISVKFMSIPKI